MVYNSAAFVIIVCCYTKIYYSIRNSQVWNSTDYRMARRMSLLVFTDFLCWAPIIFFSLTAAFGHYFLSLEEVKVFTIFVLPLNSCANPFLYAIITKQFKTDCLLVCGRFGNVIQACRSVKSNPKLSELSSRHPSVLHSVTSTNRSDKMDKTSLPLLSTSNFASDTNNKSSIERISSTNNTVPGLEEQFETESICRETEVVTAHIHGNTDLINQASHPLIFPLIDVHSNNPLKLVRRQRNQNSSSSTLDFDLVQLFQENSQSQSFCNKFRHNRDDVMNVATFYPVRDDDMSKTPAVCSQQSMNGDPTPCINGQTKSLTHLNATFLLDDNKSILRHHQSTSNTLFDNDTQHCEHTCPCLNHNYVNATKYLPTVTPTVPKIDENNIIKSLLRAKYVHIYSDTDNFGSLPCRECHCRTHHTADCLLVSYNKGHKDDESNSSERTRDGNVMVPPPPDNVTHTMSSSLPCLSDKSFHIVKPRHSGVRH